MSLSVIKIFFLHFKILFDGVKHHKTQNSIMAYLYAQKYSLLQNLKAHQGRE